MINRNRRCALINKGRIHCHNLELLPFYQFMQNLILSAHSVDNNSFNGLRSEIILDFRHTPVLYHGKKYGDDIQPFFLGLVNGSGKVLHINFIDCLGLRVQIDKQRHSSGLFGRQRGGNGIGRKFQLPYRLIDFDPGLFTHIGIVVKHLGNRGNSHSCLTRHIPDGSHIIPPSAFPSYGKRFLQTNNTPSPCNCQ